MRRASISAKYATAPSIPVEIEHPERSCRITRQELVTLVLQRCGKEGLKTKKKKKKKKNTTKEKTLVVQVACEKTPAGSQEQKSDL